LRADTLHGLQQAEPLALEIALEAEQLDLVLAHIGLDGHDRGLTAPRQRLQRARRAVHLIADTVDVEDDEVLAVRVDDAFELADHAFFLHLPRSRGRSTREARREGAFAEIFIPPPQPSPASG